MGELEGLGDASHEATMSSLLSLTLPSSGDFPTVPPTRVGLRPRLGFHRGRSSDISGHRVLLAPSNSVWERMETRQCFSYPGFFRRDVNGALSP